jgi:hypothetical protein
MRRPLTVREREVLDALLSVDFDGVGDLREQAKAAEVVAVCGCGCPSINFHDEPGVGMQVRVNATIEGSYDELFLYTLGSHLGGIEYAGVSDEGDPAEFPDPSSFVVVPA